jgi:hypothetical protein
LTANRCNSWLLSEIISGVCESNLEMGDEMPSKTDEDSSINLLWKAEEK